MCIFAHVNYWPNFLHFDHQKKTKCVLIGNVVIGCGGLLRHAKCASCVLPVGITYVDDINYHMMEVALSYVVRVEGVASHCGRPPRA